MFHINLASRPDFIETSAKERTPIEYLKATQSDSYFLNFFEVFFLWIKLVIQLGEASTTLNECEKSSSKSLHVPSSYILR